LDDICIDLAGLSDLDDLARMFHLLWPSASAEEHAEELALLLSGKTPGLLPLVIFVARASSGQAIGFAEVDLRSHADGCDPAQPVGYLEGWYVDPSYRRQGIASRLLAAAEDWARRHGAREMASDTWLDNTASQLAHEANAFEVVDRCVHYRKSL